MRKLKLQVQISVDGFVAGPLGEMDWMNMNWSDDIKDYVTELTRPVDTILLGRKLAEGFIPHWAAIAGNPDTADDFSRKMTDTFKLVFSKTTASPEWPNTAVTGGELVQEVKQQKEKEGGDIIVYGGASFVSSLIKEGLIDEFHLFVNPVVLGDGMPVFRELQHRQALQLRDSRAFDCGIVVLSYERVNPAI